MEQTEPFAKVVDPRQAMPYAQRDAIRLRLQGYLSEQKNLVEPKLLKEIHATFGGTKFCSRISFERALNVLIGQNRLPAHVGYRSFGNTKTKRLLYLRLPPE